MWNISQTLLDKFFGAPIQSPSRTSRRTRMSTVTMMTMILTLPRSFWLKCWNRLGLTCTDRGQQAWNFYLENMIDNYHVFRFEQPRKNTNTIILKKNPKFTFCQYHHTQHRKIYGYLIQNVSKFNYFLNKKSKISIIIPNSDKWFFLYNIW